MTTNNLTRATVEKQQNKDIMNTKDNALGRQVGGNHYKDYAIQPAEFCQRNKIPFCEATAIKYLCRHRNKAGKQDLEKAKHFIDILIDLEYGEQKKAVEPATEESSATEEPPELIVIVEEWVGPCGLSLEKGDIGTWIEKDNWRGYFFWNGRLQWKTIQANRTKWRALK